MAGQSRWAGLAGIAVGNLLPLWLVWTGRLGIGDLVLVYLLELGVSFVLFCVSLPRRRVRGGIRLFLTVAALGLLLAPCSPTTRWCTSPGTGPRWAWSP